MRWLCTLLVLGGVASAKPRPAPGGNLTALQVVSRTQGADIYVDGQKVGNVPQSQPITLTPGEHTIKVQKLGFAPFIDVFRIERRREPTRVQADLDPIAGVVRVTANVENARVFVDDKFAAQLPAAVEVQAGPHTVRVSKGGYKDVTQKILAVAGEELSLEAALEELPMGQNPYKPLPAPPAKLHEKWWVWTLAAVGVGAVVTVIVVPVTTLRDPITAFEPDKAFSITAP